MTCTARSGAFRKTTSNFDTRRGTSFTGITSMRSRSGARRICSCKASHFLFALSSSSRSLSSATSEASKLASFASVFFWRRAALLWTPTGFNAALRSCRASARFARACIPPSVLPKRCRNVLGKFDRAPRAPFCCLPHPRRPCPPCRPRCGRRT